ncbi:MAG: hypothetical protein R3E48_13820 [Burkholderiaceae bacterium]
MREKVLEAFRENMPAVHAEDGCIEYGPRSTPAAWARSRPSSARTASW